MKSWMTTIFGFFAAIGAVLGQVPDKGCQTAGGILTVLGTAGLGVAAKDSNVTGGTKVQ